MCRITSLRESTLMNSSTTSLTLCNGACRKMHVRSEVYPKKKPVSSSIATLIALEQVLKNISSQQTHDEMHKNWLHNIMINKPKQMCEKDIECLELNPQYSLS